MKWLVSPTHMHLASVKKEEKLKVRGKGRNKVMIRWPSTTRSILKQNTTKQQQETTTKKHRQQTKHNQSQTLHCSFGEDPDATLSGDVTVCCESGPGWLMHLKGRRPMGSLRSGSGTIQASGSALTRGRCKSLRSAQCSHTWLLLLPNL